MEREITLNKRDLRVLQRQVKSLGFRIIHHQTRTASEILQKRQDFGKGGERVEDSQENVIDKKADLMHLPRHLNAVDVIIFSDRLG